MHSTAIIKHSILLLLVLLGFACPSLVRQEWIKCKSNAAAAQKLLLPSPFLRSFAMVSLPRTSRDRYKGQGNIAHLDRPKCCLAPVPSRLLSAGSSRSASPHGTRLPKSSCPSMNRLLLPASEYVSCVLWKGIYHITRTDIVRALAFRFEAFGQPP